MRFFAVENKKKLQIIVLLFSSSRGQKYFFDNRSGIMLSNLYGLFSLICEPGGAKLLDRTQQSSTPETAKKRYISTSLNMLSWYEEELKPGSK